MCHFRLSLGLLLLGAVAAALADDRPAEPPPSLKADLEKLQGTWSPVKPIEKVGYLQLEFGKELKTENDYLVVVHAVDGGGWMLNVGNAFVRFELKESGKKRVITPVEKGERISALTYRFDGDTLVIEEGECDVHRKVSLKGEWKCRKGERAP